MKKYLLKRILQLPLILFGVLVCVFLIIQLTPGDPAATLAGPGATPEQVELIREDMGLNKPLLQQFTDYVKNILHGDFGRSYIRRTEISEGLLTAFLNTLYLVLFARVWSILAAIPLGIAAAKHQNSFFDKLCMTGSMLGVSIPTFWLGLILMYFFSFKLGWLPLSGMGHPLWSWNGIRHVILPAFILGLPQVATLARLTRSGMLEVMRQDYIRTARAKGLKQRSIIYKHALKNAALPIITVIGVQTGYMLGGAVVVENIFSWPGFGRYSITAIMGNDYPGIQASILLFALLFLVINILVDIIYSFVDPRIKY